MRSAFLYVRWSSPEQAKGNSLERQLREGRQWCERNNCVLDDSLNFLKELGQSAFRGANLEEGGGLGLFLQAVKAGKVPQGSVLLVEKLDRFSRTDIDIAVHFFGRVLRAGVNIVSMRSGTEFTLEMLRRQPTMIMSAVLEFILAAEESIKKSDRLLSAWAAKREKARQGIPQSKRGPLWLKLSDDRSNWEVIEERAAVVRRIFQMTADGIGAYRLAALFNKDGTLRLENRPHWTQKAIHRILSNRAVLGEFQPQRMVENRPVDDGRAVADYFPRIISDDLWYAAQAQIKANRVGGRKAGGRAGKLFLFQKLAFDADSASSLVVRSTRGGKRTGYIRYLMPSAGLRGGLRTTVPLDRFEEVLLTGLSEVKLSAPARPIERDIDAAKGHLERLAATIAQTTAAMASQPPELMGSVVAQIAAWTAEQKRWTAHLEELKVQAGRKDSDPVKELRDVVSLWKTGDETERAKVRAAVRSLVKRITVKIKAGKDRYTKRVGVLVEFHACAETRVFLFTTPGDGSVVLSGWTMAELAAM
jgi:DNA invertase Pin-like site-specific DNA recombinase